MSSNSRSSDVSDGPLSFYPNYKMHLSSLTPRDSSGLGVIERETVGISEIPERARGTGHCRTDGRRRERGGKEGGRADLGSACSERATGRAVAGVVVGRLVARSLGWAWLLGIARVPEIPRRRTEERTDVSPRQGFATTNR